MARIHDDAFEDPTLLVLLGDGDGDGDADLAVANQFSNSVSVLVNSMNVPISARWQPT